MAVQLAGTILAGLLLLGFCVLLKRRILVRCRRQAEEKVRQSEERLSLAIAAADLCTWDWDIRSDHLVWSPRHLELFGLSSEPPITYQRFLEANHPEDRERIDQAVRAAVERHEDYDAEMRVIRPDGTVRFLASRGRAHYDPSGRPTRMAGVVLDITRRKQSEEALRQSEERLSLALAAANLGTWDWNILSDEEVWSPCCLELFGLGLDTHMTYQRFLEAILPEDRDRIDRAIRTAVERHEDCDAEMRVVSRDGALHFLAERGRAHYDPSGRPVRMTGVAMDITERKQAEEALRVAKDELARANQDLEEKVQQRTAKLGEAMGELEHMSYSMVHDMRAPLRAMQGFATMVKEECVDRLPAGGLDYFRRVMESADRMDRLITDALNYNKIVREDLPITPVEVGRLLRGMIETYPDLQPPGAQVVIEFDELVVRGNQSLLTQCFGNLLCNAVKFVAPGVKPRVRVRAEPRGEMVRIWVEDNGIGIPKDAQERIFVMFQRLHHQSECPGTGVGLAIVRKTVERMGGRLGLESEPGKGSKFWVELLNADKAEKRGRVEDAAQERR